MLHLMSPATASHALTTCAFGINADCMQNASGRIVLYSNRHLTWQAIAIGTTLTSASVRDIFCTCLPAKMVNVIQQYTRAHHDALFLWCSHARAAMQGGHRTKRGHCIGTSEPSAPCSRSPASYRDRPLVGVPSMETMTSPDFNPALSAGPPGAGVTTCNQRFPLC